MRNGRICPILSINSYLDCKKQGCQLWLDEYEECAFHRSSLDNNEELFKIAEWLRVIAQGITYLPASRIPSISESAAIAANALSNIAGGNP